MLFRKTLFVVFTCYACFVAAQNKKTELDPTRQLVSKGRFYGGLSTQLGLGVAFPDGFYVAPLRVKPKIGYFLLDRFSIAASYQGSGASPLYTPRFALYHKGELELNYYFYAKKHLLLYTQAGVGVGRYYSPYSTNGKVTVVDYKLGTGIGWNPKRTPNLSFNLELAYHITPTPYSVRVIPELRLGVSYFFGRKSNKAKLKPLTDL